MEEDVEVVVGVDDGGVNVENVEIGEDVDCEFDVDDDDDDDVC